MTAAAVSILELLIVEDNPGDVTLFREALAEAGIDARLHTVGDGQEALDFLRRRGPHCDAPRVDAVVLDLNLPGKRGQQVLTEMSADPALRDIPVAVLTTSKSESEIWRNYTPGKCVYFAKTAQFAGLVEIARRIEAFIAAAGRRPC